MQMPVEVPVEQKISSTSEEEELKSNEELNMHFSSVFTREDTSSIPVPETKFKGSEEKGWGS